MSSSMTHKGEVVLVTGGAGFVGQHIVKLLLMKADWVQEVRVFDIQPFVNQLGYKTSKTCKSIVGDLLNMEDLNKALNGVTTVFHVASLVDIRMFPDVERLRKINVEGTRNIITACKYQNVSKLVYTSTAAMVVTDKEIIMGDESLPIQKMPFYPKDYGITKAEAEQLVKEAHGTKLDKGSSLYTVALRPNGMYGELDALGCSADIVDASEWNGKSIQLTNSNLQTTYVGNVAWAHLVAAQAISRDPKVGGQAYFVADDSPILPLHKFREPFFKRHGFRYTSWALPVGLGSMILRLIQLILIFVRYFKPSANFITSADGLKFISREYSFSSKALEEKLGYKPLYTNEEAFDLSCVYYDDIAWQRRVQRRPPSKD